MKRSNPHGLRWTSCCSGAPISFPNLVATVKGFATHEETVFGDIANARAGLLNARDPQSKIAANGQLDSAFGRLLALSENYPELKSNQNFLALQDQLEGTENRIAVERKRYNDTLQDYNTFIRQFPNSVWAGGLPVFIRIRLTLRPAQVLGSRRL